jgi:amidase
MNRRNFLASVSSAAALSAAGTQTSEFELEEITVSELQSRMETHNLTAERIVQLYLERIEAVDHSGPTLRSVIEINPDALAIARSLDQVRQAKGPRGPLHGIPVLLKDNIDTNDRMQTTAGSLALLNAPAPADSFVAARLRAAGAVILGKTNLSEWANFRSTHSTSGWSGRGGLTKNPYALDRNPCGSSSGSGVAVSANLSALAVGTETDGSVVCPASINGIVGIKPTLGLISRLGIIPIAASQDTAGPMARTVRDAAILLGVLAGTDPRDSATTGAKRVTDYTKFCDANGLRGARLGVARQYVKLGPSIDRLMKECIDLMQKAGAEIVDPVEFKVFERWRDTEQTVLLYEFKAQLTDYLSARGGTVRSLADCIAFNKAHRAEEMPFFEQELMEQAQEKGSLNEKEYKTALEKNHRYSRKEGIDAVLKQHKLNAIVAPTVGPTFATDLVNGDHIDGGCTSPAAVAGYPHITVPAGQVFGLPVGLSFFSTAWTEPTLIKLAYAFEQARNSRFKPKFLPTVELHS